VLSARGEHEVAKNHMHKALDHGATEERRLCTRLEVPYGISDRLTDAGRTYGDRPTAPPDAMVERPTGDRPPA
jgi:hypothetical protein